MGALPLKLIHVTVVIRTPSSPRFHSAERKRRKAESNMGWIPQLSPDTRPSQADLWVAGSLPQLQGDYVQTNPEKQKQDLPPPSYGSY